MKEFYRRILGRPELTTIMLGIFQHLARAKTINEAAVVIDRSRKFYNEYFNIHLPSLPWKCPVEGAIETIFFKYERGIMKFFRRAGNIPQRKNDRPYALRKKDVAFLRNNITFSRILISEIIAEKMK